MSNGETIGDEEQIDRVIEDKEEQVYRVLGNDFLKRSEKMKYWVPLEPSLERRPPCAFACG
jgi:hypothetical protein